MAEGFPVKIMGVLNVTPDSFSDGGSYFNLEDSLNQAEKLIEAGADILDVGGESTRPFADPVGTEEELARVIPVIEGIRARHSIPLSIDTYKARVAADALAAGADIINDIWALRKDPTMIDLCRETEAPIIIMHMQGTPETMQVKPRYNDVVEDILSFFSERLEWITANGVKRNRLILDPGIGFGKSLAHNLSIIKHLNKLNQFQLPVLLAHSRKRFLGEITKKEKEGERDQATAVVAALCAGDVAMVRVHDVAATREALNVAQAIASAI